MKWALVLTMACALGLEAHAASYYVVVAGLGGEPDYEQRFTSAAKELERIFKSASQSAHAIVSNNVHFILRPTCDAATIPLSAVPAGV